MTAPRPSPSVSIVIPLFNARDVIRDTLTSVLAQTWTDYEILVIDDGSTDGSVEVVRQFNAVRLLRQDHGGVAKARNRGIQESAGPYVGLLDHDDLWHPTKLEKQVRMLERRADIGMVITDVAHIDRTGRPTGIVGSGYNPSEAFARLFVRGYVPTPSATMIRRSVLEAVGGFDESFHSAGLDDHELWSRIAADYDITNIDEALTFHRNLTVKPPQIALEHRALLISKLMNRFGHDPTRRQYLLREQASYLADQGKHLVNKRRRQEGRSLLWQGLSLSLGEARSVQTAWRCLSRIARSYIR